MGSQGTGTYKLHITDSIPEIPKEVDTRIWANLIAHRVLLDELRSVLSYRVDNDGTNGWLGKPYKSWR